MRLKAILPWLLGMLLLAGLWSRFSLSQFQGAFQQVGAAIVPLICLALVWLPFDTLTLARLVERGALGPRLALLEWGSDSLCNLIPAGGWGGEPFRYRHLEPYTEHPARVVVAYRIMHAWAGFLTAVIGSALCWWTNQPGLPWRLLAGVGALIWVAGALVFLRAARSYGPGLRLSAFLPKFASRSFQVAEVGCVLWALGAPVTPSGLLLIHSTLMAASSLFAFVPGGYGVHEGALLAACRHLGMNDELGMQLGFIRRIRQLGWAMLGLLAVLYLERTRVRTESKGAP